MTTVWLVSSNVTKFNYLAKRSKRSFSSLRLTEGKSQLETWVPLEVWYHPLDFWEERGLANFPYWGVSLVCDIAARKVIRELLEDHVEFLPLIFQAPVADGSFYSIKTLRTLIGKEYFAINCLRILDCLDLDRSQFDYFDRTRSIRYIVKYEFKPDCLDGVPIFKLPMSNSVETFVTGEFKQLVEDNNLTGLEFRKVWEG